MQGRLPMFLRGPVVLVLPGGECVIPAKVVEVTEIVSDPWHMHCFVRMLCEWRGGRVAVTPLGAVAALSPAEQETEVGSVIIPRAVTVRHACSDREFLDAVMSGRRADYEGVVMVRDVSRREFVVGLSGGQESVTRLEIGGSVAWLALQD